MTGFLSLISITEIVLRSYFGTILAVDKDDGEVSDIECSNGTSYEVIRPRAVYNIQFLVIPLCMKDRRKNGITQIQFYRHEVGNGILLLYRTTTLYDSSLKQHTLGKRGLAATFGANERDVFNFVSLIYFHIKSF